MSEELGEPGNNSEKRFTDAQVDQMLHHVTAAMSMVRVLPQFAHEARADIPAIVRVACLESFFMNVRLVVEFLIKDPQGRDFGASSVVQRWIPPEQEVADRLTYWWEVASKHVAHLSMKRIAADPGAADYEDTSPEGLQGIAADCEAEWKRFELLAGIYLGPYTGAESKS